MSIGARYGSAKFCEDCSKARCEARAKTERYRESNRVASRRRNRTPERLAYLKAWHEANPRDRSAYKKAYDAAHAAEIKAYVEANRERLAASKRAYYKANRERILASSKAWSEAHPGRVLARVAAWQKANPERDAANRSVVKSRRRVRKTGAGGSHTGAQRLAKFAALGNICFYCGKSGKLEADHDVPIARGGTDDISNILPACRSCNAKKSARTAAEFIAWRSRMSLRKTG